ncbi:MAG: hypothetical protein HZB25_05040 [Candidatus Eisenbacteria bacterium]|nr:hypothetical protein [Candidatus Eisenbacteria bacterium]
MVQKFSSDGAFVAGFLVNDLDNGRPANVSGVAVDPTGRIYVLAGPSVAGGNVRILVLSSDGAALNDWIVDRRTSSIAMGPNAQLFTVGSHYISSIDGPLRVTVYDHSGVLQRYIDVPSINQQWPNSLAVDASGRVYVSIRDLRGVYSISGGGATLVGGPGRGDRQFTFPGGLAVDAAGNLYAGDLPECTTLPGHGTTCVGGQRIGVFETAGGYHQLGSGLVYSPVGLAVSTQGFLFVVDGCKVHRFHVAASPSPGRAGSSSTFRRGSR